MDRSSQRDKLRGTVGFHCRRAATATWRAPAAAYRRALEAARPTADLLLPTLSEHTIGQLLQMLMLATVVEGRLAGTNPYGQPGVEAYKRNMMGILRSTPNLPKGEVRDQANSSGPGTTRIAGGG